LSTSLFCGNAFLIGDTEREFFYKERKRKGEGFTRRKREGFTKREREKEGDL